MAAICHGPAAFVDVPEKLDGTEGYVSWGMASLGLPGEA